MTQDIDRIDDEKAPLGLEEEFPQYVWLPQINRRSMTISTRVDGEWFVACFATQEEALEAPYNEPRRSWIGRLFRRSWDRGADEWAIDELCEFVKTGIELMNDKGGINRGLALFSAGKILAKRYVR